MGVRFVFFALLGTDYFGFTNYMVPVPTVHIGFPVHISTIYGRKCRNTSIGLIMNTTGVLLAAHSYRSGRPSC